ncbi:unnamed protein product [Phytophthora fragariaefolia]|uniref:Unnamed protein product n=1 Tax=Phytophthora fragariaefolia TaxID=1490495 RepID=A0A9W6Y7M2_9STRA|nr:unnamed protein product [Phytophthora fragariaefolia]
MRAMLNGLLTVVADRGCSGAAALTSLGAVCSPASPMFLPDELAVQIKAAKAKYIITHKGLEKTAVEAAKLCNVQKKFIYTMGHVKDTEEGLSSIEYVPCCVTVCFGQAVAEEG